MADAVLKSVHNERSIVLAAVLAACEVLQMADGKAGVALGSQAGASGDIRKFATEGVYEVTKAANLVWVKGDPLWWDHSANAATVNEPLGAGDKDFYLGTAAAGATAAATTGQVNLNAKPEWIIDSTRDYGATVLVKTAGTPSLISRGAMMAAAFSATAEAQKIDWLSGRSFALGSNWVMEALVNLVETCDADVGDLSIGVINATHASDADAITESALFHFDLGADLNIDAESDDGTTEVAATDTTIDIAAGTPVRLKLDGRDPSNVKYYINGAEVLSATANLGNIAAAAGPLFAALHLEKSSNDSPGSVECRIRVRTMEVD